MSAQSYYTGQHATRALPPNFQYGLPQSGLGPLVWRGGIEKVRPLNAHSHLPPAEPYSYVIAAPTVPVLPYQGMQHPGYGMVSHTLDATQPVMPAPVPPPGSEKVGLVGNAAPTIFSRPDCSNNLQMPSSGTTSSVPSFSMTSSLSGAQNLAVQSPAPFEGDELDQVLAIEGYAISRHEIFEIGLPPGALGRGGFGMVYKARKGMQDFAIKQIENFSLTEAAVLLEAKILTLLDHPSIVRFVEAISYTACDWLFIVMELVDGADLLQVLTAQPHIFNEAAIRPMMFHLSAGVAYAHQVGVMHRDLKPQNILLCQDGFPKLVDFGLSRSVGSQEVLQSMVGTPGYIAPEIQDPRVPYSFPADVYSLGLVFSDMLHESYCCHWGLGLIPPDMLHRYEKRWPVGHALPNIGTSLRGIVRQMVVDVPGERLTLYDVCHALTQLTQDEPLPHYLWSVQTKLPSDQLPKKCVTASLAADIAGRGGYAVGCSVQVLVDGVWHRGMVQHISTSLCPGAAQVHYRQGDEDMAILICPWQFPDVLRPAPTTPEPSQAAIPVGTMTFLPPVQASGSSPTIEDTIPLTSSKIGLPLRSASTASDDIVGIPGKSKGMHSPNASETKVSAKAALEDNVAPQKQLADICECGTAFPADYCKFCRTCGAKRPEPQETSRTFATCSTIPINSGTMKNSEQSGTSYESYGFKSPTGTPSLARDQQEQRIPSRGNHPAAGHGMNLRSAVFPLPDTTETEVDKKRLDPKVPKPQPKRKDKQSTKKTSKKTCLTQ